jgi:hypothetical protein
MRTIALMIAAVCIAAPATGQETPGRLGTKPPHDATSVENKGSPATAIQAIAPGISVISSEGQAVGQVFEVTRSTNGRVNRVLIAASDGKHRAVPAANIRFEDGEARLTLSRAQLMALPAAQP